MGPAGENTSLRHLLRRRKFPEPALHTLPLSLGLRDVPDDSGESPNQPIITNQ